MMRCRLIFTLLVVQLAILHVRAIKGFVSPGNAGPVRVPTQLRMFGKNSNKINQAAQQQQESKSSSSSSPMTSVPRIAVKPRPLVSLDEKTGRYIPPPKALTPDSSSVSPQDQEEFTYNDSLGGWGAFKDGVYGIVDSVSGLRSNKTPNGIADRTISVAYSDTVGKKASPSSPDSTPGKRLLETYNKSLKNDPETREDISTGENLFTSDTRKTFNIAKDTFYNAVDALGKKEKTEKDEAADISIEMNLFRVATKPSFNEEESVALVSSQLDDLVSTNPLKRFKARVAIATEQRKRERNLQANNKNQAFAALKNMFYSFVETCQAIYLIVLSIPEEVEKMIEATQDAMETTQTQIQSSIVEIQQTPDKIEQAVVQTRATTTETIETIKQIPIQVESKLTETKEGITKTIQEVQAIPGKVEQTVTETKKSIEDTKQGVANFVQKVEDLTFDAKVMVGLEKAKPPPPPPPPPPKTSQDIAREVAGEAVKLAGKGAVVVAKGTAGMGISGAKLAWNAATKAQEKKKMEQQQKKELQRNVEESVRAAATSAKAEDIIPKRVPKAENLPKPPRTIAEIDPLLEKEVAEALRVAEEALAAGKQEQAVAIAKTEGIPTMDINEAVMKAKEAAAQARKDAAELEAMLMERKYYVKE